MKKIQDILLLDDALEDIERGKYFYDSINYGAGEYFIDCLLSDISSLKIYAGIQKKHFGFYRLFSKTFPYAIYYDVVNDVVRVAAVLDMRRNPNMINATLTKRIKKN